jgi:lipoprotein LprG
MLMATLASVLVLLSACGTGGGTKETPTPPPPSAQEILTAASQRLAQTQTVHFTLDVQGQTYIDDARTMQLISAAGDLERPGKVSVQFKIKILGAPTISIQMITIGDKAWTTDLLSGKWQPAPKEFGYNPSVLFDTKDGLGPVVGGIQNPRMVGTESVNGTPAYHIRGTVPAAMIGPLTDGTMTGNPITVDVLIGKEKNELLQATLKEPQQAGKKQPAVWTLSVSDYDKNVSIEAPV